MKPSDILQPNRSLLRTTNLEWERRITYNADVVVLVRCDSLPKISHCPDQLQLKLSNLNFY